MRVWQISAIVVGAATTAALGFVGWVYAASEAKLHSYPKPPAFAAVIPTDAEAIARGEHLVLTRGCSGCHGAHLEGAMFDFAAAPNLTRLAREVGAADLEAAIRHGIGHDGRALYSMPAYNFKNLRDADVASIIAYLRAVPVVDGPALHDSLPFLIRLDIALGRDDAIPGFLDRVPALRRQEDPDPRIARGEYIAMTSCNECHGFSLRHDVPWPDEAAPDLIAVIGGYSEPEFAHLMRTGEPIGGRDLRLMDDVARSRFVHWTEQEVADLYAYLSDRSAHLADEPVP